MGVSGINIKAQQGRERKAQREAEKKHKEELKKQAIEDLKWKEGIKDTSKREELERKKHEKFEKKRELKDLLQKEESQLTSKPLAKVPKATTDADKFASLLSKSVEAVENNLKQLPSPIPSVSTPSTTAQPVFSASTLDDAIFLLNSDDGGKSSLSIERHPERRVKAAYKQFEEAELPKLKQENPYLKLSQLKELLAKNWKKSPLNPFNQEHAAYDVSKQQEKELLSANTEKKLEQLKMDWSSLQCSMQFCFTRTFLALKNSIIKGNLQSRRFIFTQHVNKPQLFTCRFSFRSGHSQQRRFFSFGSIAKFPIRLVIGGTTAAVGYVSWKVAEAKEWVDENLLSLLDSLNTLKAFKLVRKASKTENLQEVPQREQELVMFAENPGQLGLLIKRMIEIRNLLKVANSHSTSTTETLPLPTIVVIGSQSSGKSSVLESIVGKNFLPKGQNMVTRRPLEITLIHTENSHSIESDKNPTEMLSPERLIFTEFPSSLVPIKDGSLLVENAQNPSGVSAEYAIFPQLMGTLQQPIYDFDIVRETLLKLNQEIPSGEWVTDKPVELYIYSPNVPDLSLVDLPGYIAITNKNQPYELRQKIIDLCGRYIEPERKNIILAVSAADVDLANSEALKASRTVDPNGKRTIGVITKVDLVPPESIISILDNHDYPLELGYVGVVSKSKKEENLKKSFFSTQSSIKGTLSDPDYYFSQHPSIFASYKSQLGIKSLQLKLLTALEQEMSASMQDALMKIESQLEDASYKFKVLYNDKPISMESYVSFIANALKENLKAISLEFSKSSLQSQIRQVLEDKLKQMLKDSFWYFPTQDNEPSSNSSLDPKSTLFECTSNLTKMGVGKLTTQLVINQLIDKIKEIGTKEPFSYHKSLVSLLVNGTLHGQSGLKSKLQHTINQIENSTKPLKFQVEFSPQEWSAGRSRAMSLIKNEIQLLNDRLAKIIKKVGHSNIINVLEMAQNDSTHLNSSAQSSQLNDDLSFNNSTVMKFAEEAAILNHKIKLLKNRLSTIENANCIQPKSVKYYNEQKSFFGKFKRLLYPNLNSPDLNLNQSAIWEFTKEKGLLIQKDPCQFECPEVYLEVILEKLVSICHAHVHFEIIQDYLNPPMSSFSSMQSNQASISSSLGLSMSTLSQPGMSYFGQLLGGNRGELRDFVNENPSIKLHLDLQERKEALERAYEKLSYLLMMKGTGNF